MSIILSDDLLTMQFPKSCIVIRTSCDQVCRIGTKSAVPDPALVTRQCTFQLERLRILWIRRILAGNGDHGFEILDFPYLCGMVCRAGCEVFNIWRQQDTGDVVLVCRKMGDRDKGGLFAILEEVPDINITLVIVS